MTRSARAWSGEQGQSLVEIALTLPLLLMTVLGVVDAGRTFYYTSALANAAHVGALYAATHIDTATTASVAARVCNETGFADYSDAPTCSDLTTTATFGPGQDAIVTVVYDFRPVSAYLASRLYPVGPLRLRATATFPSLQ
jgi:Flp pilus assembly protein TadG